MRRPTASRIVRDATVVDAAACREIYAPYVLETAVTFELDVPSEVEMGERIARAEDRHAWLVLEDTQHIAGYAYAGPFRTRPAYRWSCETSIYLRRGHRGTGAGTMLYQALLDRLAARGFVTAVAGTALPNDASLGLHRSLGFTDVGTFTRVGYKLGTWHDVAWMQRALSDPEALPQAART